LSAFNIIIIFIIGWWICWFVTLPFGQKMPEKVELGNAPSAPKKPRLIFRAGITTGMAIILTTIVALVINSDWIDLKS